MKKVLLFMLMCVLSLHAYSQSKDYYYQHGGLLYHLSFYTDKENDYVADAFCLNMFYKFGYKILEGNYVSSHSHMLQNKKWFRPSIRHSQFRK